MGQAPDGEAEIIQITIKVPGFPRVATGTISGRLLGHELEIENLRLADGVSLDQLSHQIWQVVGVNQEDGSRFGERMRFLMKMGENGVRLEIVSPDLADAAILTDGVVAETAPVSPMDPTYYDMQPPLVSDLRQHLIDQSDLFLLGEYQIQKADFDRVTDPKYPWQALINKPYIEAGEEAQKIKDQQKTEVDHYRLHRSKFWKQYDVPQQYPNSVEKQVTVHHGVSRETTTVHEETTTQRLETDLGLSFGANMNLMDPTVPADVPPVPPVGMDALIEAGPVLARQARAMKMAAAEKDGGSGNSKGGDANANVQFTWEVSHALHFSQTDTTTYEDYTSTLTTETFQGGCTYIPWQITERLEVQAYATANDPNPRPVSSVDGATARQYIQPFCPDSKGVNHE